MGTSDGGAAGPQQGSGYGAAAHAPAPALHSLALPLLMQQQMNPLYESAEGSPMAGGAARQAPPRLDVPATAGYGSSAVASWWCPSPAGSDKVLGLGVPEGDESLPGSPVATVRLLG